MKPILRTLSLAAATALAAPCAFAAGNDIKDNEFNPVNTGVTTLSITPDARGSALGNLGAATDQNTHLDTAPADLRSPTLHGLEKS